MTPRCAGVALVLLMLAVCPPVATAQAGQDCTYASCALRIRHSLFSTQLVQGQAERRVASLGLFPPEVPLFAERSDTSARHYAAFRRRHTTGALLALAGSVALAAGVFVDDSDVGLILVAGGGLLGITGGIQATRAQDRLSQAIWWYNRTLAE